MTTNTTKAANGVLQCLPKGGAFLRDPKRSYQPGSEDVWVSSKLIRKYRLADGAVVEGAFQRGQKGLQLTSVETICGLTPEQFQGRTRFDRLIPIDPQERIALGDGGKIGTYISLPLTSLFGTIASILFLVALVLISFLIILDVGISFATCSRIIHKIVSRGSTSGFYYGNDCRNSIIISFIGCIF